LVVALGIRLTSKGPVIFKQERAGKHGKPFVIYKFRSMASDAELRRLSVKPGLPYLWQISGRNQVRDFRDWVRLDLEYIDRRSLGLDFEILLRTIPAVFFGFGAK